MIINLEGWLRCVSGWEKKDVALWNDIVYKPTSQDPTENSSHAGKEEKKSFRRVLPHKHQERKDPKQKTDRGKTHYAIHLVMGANVHGKNVISYMFVIGEVSKSTAPKRTTNTKPNVIIIPPSLIYCHLFIRSPSINQIWVMSAIMYHSNHNSNLIGIEMSDCCHWKVNVAQGAYIGMQDLL